MRTAFITVNMKKWGNEATIVIIFIHLERF